MEGRDRFIRFLMLLLMAGLLGAWFHVYAQAYTAADTLWLAEAAARFLNGERMAAAYYDPNPPLSVILYVPPALLTQWGLMPVHMSVFYYTLLILALTSLLLYKTLKAAPGSDEQTAFLCTSAFIIANTVLTGITFTERDQILGMALCPFVLTQVFITKRWPLPRWLFHTALFLGAVLVLLKPHHGLLPVLIILHRALTQKRLDVWKDADFIYLACCTSAYLVLCLTYFSDYTFGILPDVLSLYSKTATPVIVQYYAHYVLIFAGVMAAGFLLNGRKPSWPGTFLLACAVIAFIAYAAQMRGYHYHMLPAVMFFAMGLACTIKDTAVRFLDARYAMPAALVAVMALALLHYPLMRTFPTHEQYYKDMPISGIVRQCPAPCPFFMMNDTMEIVHQTAAYNDRPWASRFPSVWFIPAIINLLGEGRVEEATALRDKYGKMVGEDLARYKPKLVLLAEFKVTRRGTINFSKFFSANPEFRSEWAKYRLAQRVTIDQGVYFRGTAQDKHKPMTYQIYERIE